jgi:hypothetical protein
MLKSLTLYPRSLAIKLAGRRQALLVTMLALLHIALLQDIGSDLGRIFLLPHFGLFLLWQPFVSAQSRIPNRQTLITIGILLVAAFWMSWPLIGLWLMLLAGMVGGRVFFYSGRATRIFYLLALTYLIVTLLLLVLPHVVAKAIVPESLLMPLAEFGAPLLIVAMALLPESRERDSTREAIDLAYSVFLMLMLAVLALGSVSLMLLKQVDYIQALLITLFSMAIMLLIASWLWNPVAGFSGLGATTSRYMLSLGLPFEQWIRSLTELAQRESDPALFLDGACDGMVEQLPWVSSCVWSDVSDNSSKTKLSTPSLGNAGVQTVFRQGDLTLTLTTQQPLAPMLVWHFNLVAQLVTRFYVEKNRDRQLREMAYMQAVHETGARVTHDVKNLLQSLNALLFVISEPGDEPSARSQSLLRRQLPLIAQRLEQTLGKLKVPDSEQSELISGAVWWSNLQLRYEDRNVNFESMGDLKDLIPAMLFTTAAENLLQNALDKRAGEPKIDITIRLDMSEKLPTLCVCDTGSPVPYEKADDLGNRPVTSENGLGIGLYQLSRLAALSNYVLELSTNRLGDICFSLRPKVPG